MIEPLFSNEESAFAFLKNYPYIIYLGESSMELSKQVIGYSRSRVKKELLSLEEKLQDAKEALQKQKKSNQDLKRELQYFKSRETMFVPIFNQSAELSEGVIAQGEADAEAVLAATRQELLAKKTEQTFDDNEIKAKKQMILEQELLIKNDTKDRLVQWLEDLRTSDYRLFQSNVTTTTEVMNDLEQRLTSLTKNLEKEKAQVQMAENEQVSVPEYFI